jgi:hypothetical protein
MTTFVKVEYAVFPSHNILLIINRKTPSFCRLGLNLRNTGLVFNLTVFAFGILPFAKVGSVTILGTIRRQVQEIRSVLVCFIYATDYDVDWINLAQGSSHMNTPVVNRALGS